MQHLVLPAPDVLQLDVKVAHANHLPCGFLERSQVLTPEGYVCSFAEDDVCVFDAGGEVEVAHEEKILKFSWDLFFCV